MAMECVFYVKAFQFSKFYENVGKLHKGNFKPVHNQEFFRAGEFSGN